MASLLNAQDWIIRHKQGLAANLPAGALTMAQGELAYTTDEKQLYVCDGSQKTIPVGGRFTRVATQFDKTNTTLGDITGLSINCLAALSYGFRAVLHVTADATGGHKYAIAGTATATAIIYQIMSTRNDTSAAVITSRQTALAGAAGAAGGTTIFTLIQGLITVNAAGTLTVQFAQNAASGTSSILVGSVFRAFAVT